MCVRQLAPGESVTVQRRRSNVPAFTHPVAGRIKAHQEWREVSIRLVYSLMTDPYGRCELDREWGHRILRMRCRGCGRPMRAVTNFRR